MRVATLLILSACGSPANSTLANQTGPTAATGSTSYSAELAHMMASIADATCGCPDKECASSNAMAAMVLVNDLGNVISKVPSEESFPDSDAEMLGKLDAMAGLDTCWIQRASWEMERAGVCYARLTGGKPPAQVPAPTCAPVSRAVPPKLDEWWTLTHPCGTNAFEDERSNSFQVRRCVTDGVTQDDRETRWWLYNKMPAYQQTATGWTYWYPDGKPAATQTRDKATDTTTLTRWYPNGNKRDERTYIGPEGDEEAGTRIDYWPSGAKRIARTYRGTSVRTYWYVSGTKAAEVGFSGATQHGAFTYWHPNGKVKQTGAYLFGREHGVFDEFDEAGTSIKREYYDHGTSNTTPKNYGKPKLTAATLLTEDMVRALGYAGAVVAEETDETDSTTDHVRYRAPDKPASFDIELRFWVKGGGTTPRRWVDELRDDFDKVTDIKLGDVAFLVDGPKSTKLVVHDKRGITMLLDCGKSRCPTTSDAMKLATTIHGKLPATLP